MLDSGKNLKQLKILNSDDLNQTIPNYVQISAEKKYIRTIPDVEIVLAAI